MMMMTSREERAQMRRRRWITYRRWRRQVEIRIESVDDRAGRVVVTVIGLGRGTGRCYAGGDVRGDQFVEVYGLHAGREGIRRR